MNTITISLFIRFRVRFRRTYKDTTISESSSSKGYRYFGVGGSGDPGPFGALPLILSGTFGAKPY